MLERFYTRCVQRIQLKRVKINIHIRKTLWSEKEPLKVLLYCVKVMQRLDCLDILASDSLSKEVVVPMRAKELSEALYVIVDKLNHDQSVRHFSYLGFFTKMNGREFITDVEKGAIYDSGRPHIQFHLIAIEVIANFINEDHSLSEKEYARFNKRTLLQHVGNFQMYLDSLLSLCDAKLIRRELMNY